MDDDYLAGFYHQPECSFSDQMPKFFISFDEVDQLGVYSGFHMSVQEK